MKPRSAAIVACRIIAVFLAVEVVPSIISFLLVVRTFTGTSTFWAFVGARIIAAWALWIFADRIGELMASGTEDTGSIAHPLIDVLTVAFTIVGVVLIAQAIPALVQVAAQPSAFDLPFAPLRLTPSAGGFFGDRGAAIAGEIVRLAIGVVLMVAARPLSNVLSRRSPGGSPPSA